MQSTRIVPALALAAAALAVPAGASDLSAYTVKQLLEPCVEGDNDSRWGAAAEAECEQYILGFTDAYILTVEKGKVCLPELNRPDEVRWAFMRWAHENFDDIGLIAVSGTDPRELGLQVGDGQINAWLPKPLNVERLMETLERLLRTSAK